MILNFALLKRSSHTFTPCRCPHDGFTSSEILTALRVVRRRPGLSRAFLAGIASGRRREDAGVVRFRLRSCGCLTVVGFMPGNAGTPDRGGEIWGLGLLPALFVLRWPELEAAKSATTPSNKSAVVFFLQVWILPAVSPPLAGRGGEGRWRCTGGSTPVRAAGAPHPPLAGLGGEGKGWCSSWRSDQAWERIPGAAACRPDLLHPPSLAGRGGEGRRSWVWMLLVSSRRLLSPLNLKMWLIPSGGEEHRRYPWPRGPHRTSGVPAPRSYLFLQAVMPMQRISDLDTTIHPGSGPSGVVPGVVVSGRCSRSWRSSSGEEGPDHCLAPLPRVLSCKI
jgi:hypothetical protein